jgi:hypothetical protein
MPPTDTVPLVDGKLKYISSVANRGSIGMGLVTRDPHIPVGPMGELLRAYHQRQRIDSKRDGIGIFEFYIWC